ncbi:MAG: ABC transporter ATP-binding protein [Alphaproteobacteria bacterium GM7ARS4]|nr:ABC transporter ATP-binding protein [Alphaproteobacteria bacterium GM7ARS4]
MREGTFTGGETILALDKVSHWFVQGGHRIDILRRVDFSLRCGEKVAIMGRSGAGKSTLLHIASLLERPCGGDVIIEGRSVSSLGDKARSLLRLRSLGFVYQYHHLLGDFSALENIMLACMIGGMGRGKALRKAHGLLRQLGLSARCHHRPGQLSGGEQQRIALARAVANGPSIVLADEPTGNLDRANGLAVLEMLMALATRYETALVIATHDMRIAQSLDKVFVLEEGALIPQT